MITISYKEIAFFLKSVFDSVWTDLQLWSSFHGLKIKWLHREGLFWDTPYVFDHNHHNHYHSQHNLYWKPRQGEHNSDNGDKLHHPSLVSQGVLAYPGPASLKRICCKVMNMMFVFWGASCFGLLKKVFRFWEPCVFVFLGVLVALGESCEFVGVIVFDFFSACVL